MRLRRSVLRCATWACAAVASLVLAAHVASVWWYFSWQVKLPAADGQSTRIIILHDGMLSWSRQYAAWYSIPDSQGHSQRPLGSALKLVRLDFSYQDLKPGFWLGVPTLMPVLVACGVTGALWLLGARQRRRTLGTCHRCGYDRHGLGGSAACPECGVAPGLGEAEGRAPS